MNELNSMAPADQANKDLLGKWGENHLSATEADRVVMRPDQVPQALAHVDQIISNHTLPTEGETVPVSFGGEPKEVTVTGLPEAPAKDAKVGVDIQTAAGIVKSNIDAQALANLNAPKPPEAPTPEAPVS